MGPDFLSLDARFAVKPLLDKLRLECGDAEFGYRMQALFAHVLLRLGAVICEINAQGHPDIRATLGDTVLFVQVKSVQHGNPFVAFQLSSADLTGIASAELTTGYLALLDCADPVSWIVVEVSKVSQFLNRSISIAGLRAAEEPQLSKDCTDEFTGMLLAAKDRLSTLTFSLLVRRALAGKPM